MIALLVAPPVEGKFHEAKQHPKILSTTRNMSFLINHLVICLWAEEDFPHPESAKESTAGIFTILRQTLTPDRS